MTRRSAAESAHAGLPKAGRRQQSVGPAHHPASCQQPLARPESQPKTRAHLGDVGPKDTAHTAARLVLLQPRLQHGIGPKHVARDDGCANAWSRRARAIRSGGVGRKAHNAMPACTARAPQCKRSRACSSHNTMAFVLTVGVLAALACRSQVCQRSHLQRACCKRQGHKVKRQRQAFSHTHAAGSTTGVPFSLHTLDTPPKAPDTVYSPALTFRRCFPLSPAAGGARKSPPCSTSVCWPTSAPRGSSAKSLRDDLIRS
jgi:hypothetical protein